MASVTFKGSDLRYKPEIEAQITEIKKNRAYRDDLDIERAQALLQRRERGVYIILPNVDSGNKFTIVQATIPGKNIFQILELEIEASKVTVYERFNKGSEAFDKITVTFNGVKKAMEYYKKGLSTPYDESSVGMLHLDNRELPLIGQNKPKIGIEAQIAKIKENNAYRDDLDIQGAEFLLRNTARGVFIILPKAGSENKFTIVQATIPGKNIFQTLQLEIEESNVKVFGLFPEQLGKFSNVEEAMRSYRGFLITPYGDFRDN